MVNANANVFLWCCSERKRVVGVVDERLREHVVDMGVWCGENECVFMVLGERERKYVFGMMYANALLIWRGWCGERDCFFLGTQFMEFKNLFPKL